MTHVKKLPTNYIITSFLLSTTIGIAFVYISYRYYLMFVTILALALLPRLMGYKGRFLISVMVIGSLLGIARGENFKSRILKYDRYKYHTVKIIGVSDSNAIYSDHSQIAFDIGNVGLVEPELVQLPGKISVKGFGVPMIYRGDRVEVTGRLGKGFGSKQANMTFSQVSLIEHSQSIIESSRRRFESGLSTALPEPIASFGLGLLIGQRTTIPKYVSTQLSVVGLTHVVAVSGYNLTIIIYAARLFLKRRSKYQSTILSLVLIQAFLLFAGLSASIVRAAIVGVLGLWAWYYGRTFNPIVLIMLAATITSYAYPIYVWHDVGWYLSFLAFFGILVIAPLLHKKFYRDKKPKILILVLFETLAAQIMTFPIIMYSFGKFSMVAVLANLLIVPLVPLAMLFCLVAGLAGMFIAPISGWLALPGRILLTYMLDIVSAMSRFPKASVAQYLALSQMVLIYFFIFLSVFILWHKLRAKSDIITDINQPATGEI